MVKSSRLCKKLKLLDLRECPKPSLAKSVNFCQVRAIACLPAEMLQPTAQHAATAIGTIVFIMGQPAGSRLHTRELHACLRSSDCHCHPARRPRMPIVNAYCATILGNPIPHILEPRTRLEDRAGRRTALF